ncbi:glycosyltransferase family 4 protein [bacterium]|nr:glycosyltransferase family 4 protein [bacterium]
MKIAIISPDYPSQTTIPFMFVHVRAKLYQKFGHQVRVFVNSPSESSYRFDGISIRKLPKQTFAEGVHRFEPDVIAVYYATFWMIPLVRQLPYPKVVWVLGHEVLWAFRLTSSKNLFDWLKKRCVLLPRLAYQMSLMRSFLHEVDQAIFVSRWLLQAAERNFLCQFQNATVIPNPVDTDLFFYKAPTNINKGLSLRSLERSVYGLDVAIKAFASVTAASLTIIGRGRFQKKYERLISRHESNARINPEYVLHQKLPALFHRFGFFVAPSRQETQGLAMCEAMACGLPVVASRVGGIPEFVTDGVDGYLVEPNNPTALKRAVVRLATNKSEFLQMSIRAREDIHSRCDSTLVTSRELDVLRAALNSRALVNE